MFYLGGLAIGTEMMSYSPDKNGKCTHKLQVEHLGLDDNNQVALFNLWLDYDTRFTPPYLAIKSISCHNIRLVFEDGFTVVCSVSQKFFMSDYTWKEAKDLTCDDEFFQVFRHPKLTEFFGDFCADDCEFEMYYVPDDLKRIKIKSTELLPQNHVMPLAIPVDWNSQAIVLGNGAVIEGICLLGHPAQKTQFDMMPPSLEEQDAMLERAAQADKGRTAD
ncbi:hypothetical protein IJT17_08840 [bacterium]|nr:hypothetical protein [bacterium]